MTKIGWFLAAPLFGAAVMVVVHTWICRKSGERRFLGGVATAFAIGLAAFALWQTFLLWQVGLNAEALVLAIPVNLPLYVCLAYCYYNFVNLGHASIRIRIYAECQEHGGEVSVVQLAETYNDELLKASRIRRLLEGGDMIRRGDGYFPGSRRLVPVATMVFALKRFVLGRASEFDHLA